MPEKQQSNHKRGRRPTLTESQVREIRRRYAAGGITYRELADEYGVSIANIFRIIKLEYTADMEEAKKNNARRGEAHEKTPFTESQVREIRRRYAAGGITYRELADEYGVSLYVIFSIIKAAYTADMAGTKRVNTSKLTEFHANEIRGRYAVGGITYRELAAEYGVSAQTIANIIKRVTWAHLGDTDEATVDYMKREDADSSSKLTAAQVDEIRGHYAAGGITYRELAAEHGVSINVIAQIVKHLIWAHLGDTDDTDDEAAADKRARGEAPYASKLTADQVREIRGHYAAGGITYRELAAEHGVSINVIAQIVKHLIWAHLGDTDDTDDEAAADKRARGEAHYASKLTADQVREIRRSYAAGGITQRELAAEYGVSIQAIGHIIKHLTWAHLDAPDTDEAAVNNMPRGEAHPASKLTADQVREIRRSYTAGGITYRELAAEYGVSEITVRLIVKHRAWAHVE